MITGVDVLMHSLIEHDSYPRTMERLLIIAGEYSSEEAELRARMGVASGDLVEALSEELFGRGSAHREFLLKIDRHPRSWQENAEREDRRRRRAEHEQWIARVADHGSLEELTQ